MSSTASRCQGDYLQQWNLKTYLFLRWFTVCQASPRWHIRDIQLPDKNKSIGRLCKCSRVKETIFFLFLYAGGVISYIGSNGSSPSRTSPISLCGSDSCQLSSHPAFPNYFPPSPTGSLVQDSGRLYGGGSAGLCDDASPSSSSSSSSAYSSGGSPVGLQVTLDDGRHVSPIKSTSSSITSEWWSGKLRFGGWDLIENAEVSMDLGVSVEMTTSHRVVVGSQFHQLLTLSADCGIQVLQFVSVAFLTTLIPAVFLKISYVYPMLGKLTNTEEAEAMELWIQSSHKESHSLCLSPSELNGMVLLCKVCGDVASGFHYGVHACEGCKVKFLMYIQQKHVGLQNSSGLWLWEGGYLNILKTFQHFEQGKICLYFQKNESMRISSLQVFD